MAGNLSGNNTAGTARRQHSQSEQGERSDAQRTKNVGAVQLRGRSCYRDRFDNRGIVILRLVDARGDRPHPHRLRRERPHQVTRKAD